jgi:hypothetical protein
LRDMRAQLCGPSFEAEADQTEHPARPLGFVKTVKGSM